MEENKKIYDLICVGAGSGGLNISSFMANVGFSVLIIEKSDWNIGGDCLNYGCVPSKALIKIAKLVHDSNESRKFGITSTNRVNIKKVVSYIKERQNIIRDKHDNANHLRSKGIDVVFGEAELSGKNSINVNGKDYFAKKIVISTGSRPRPLKVEGIEKVKSIYTNETIFDIKKLPRDLLVIGGGPIGVELGQAFSRLGSNVTIIQRGSQFLAKEDSEISEILHKQLISEGIKIHLLCEPIKFKSSNILITKSPKTDKTNIKFDAILNSTGRILNIPNGLEKASVSLTEDKRKIIVNEYLQTTNPKIYLCGDIAGMHQFTHAAELHTSVILKNFFSPLKKKLDNSKLSWVTYTDPEIASFGLNEEEIKSKNIIYKKVSQDYSEVDRGITDNSKGLLKLFVSNKNKILGGTIIAPNAGEIFQELSLAQTSKLSIKHLFDKIYPYPTASRINKSAISKIFKEKLNVKAKKMLKSLYKIIP